jgi:hypothetical protein
MSAELVPVQPHPAERAVHGTLEMCHGELVVRVSPDDYHDAPTRLLQRSDPTTLADVECMRFVGPCVGVDAFEHYRRVAWCQRHPVLAWIRGWTR